jgi:hypothetical protein
LELHRNYPLPVPWFDVRRFMRTCADASKGLFLKVCEILLCGMWKELTMICEVSFQKVFFLKWEASQRGSPHLMSTIIQRLSDPFHLFFFASFSPDNAKVMLLELTGYLKTKSSGYFQSGFLEPSLEHEENFLKVYLAFLQSSLPQNNNEKILSKFCLLFPRASFYRPCLPRKGYCV